MYFIRSENKGKCAPDLRPCFRISKKKKKKKKQFFSRSGSYMYLSRVMRKPTFCICENKDADQLRGNREADQRLCFRYIDSTIPILSKSEISSL